MSADLIQRMNTREQLLRDLLDYFRTRGFDCFNTARERELIDRLEAEFPDYETTPTQPADQA